MNTPPPPSLEPDREPYQQGELSDAELAELLRAAEAARGEGLRERLRALPTPLRTGLALGIGGLAVAGLLAAGVKQGLAEGRMPELALIALVFGLAGVAGARGLRGLGRPWPRWPALLAGMAAVAGLALVPLSPLLLSGSAAPALLSHLSCAAVGLSVGGTALLGSWLVQREDRPARWRAANAGTSAALLALGALLLHCPYVDSAHQALGHVLGGVALSALWVLVAARR